MNNNFKDQRGFSVIEMVVVLAAIGIMAAVAVPSLSAWVPSYKLRTAAMDLHSNLQLAKMQAIKDNSTCRIEFDEDTQVYQIKDNADAVLKTVNLMDYGNGIAFGRGPAPAGEVVDYEGDQVVFNSQGMAQSGFIYLENENKDRSFRVGSQLSGIIRIEKWNGSDWD